MSTASHNVIGRRSELLAELFLQELEPKFLTRPSLDIGFDFLVGFQNVQGSVNTFSVEVKGTEQPVSSSFPVEKRVIRHLATSNLPGFLLVVDVKRNQLYYGWPNREETALYEGSGRINFPVTKIDEQTRSKLRHRLTH